MKEALKITGHVKLTLLDKDGKLKKYYEDHNLVVTVGKSYLTQFLATDPQTGTFAGYVGVGTGTATPSPSDTDLQSPLPTRIKGTLSSASNTWTNNALFPATVDTGDITEAGLFSTSTGGTLFAHQIFPVFHKDITDTFLVNWTVTFS
jgi:hypothetical protein